MAFTRRGFIIYIIILFILVSLVAACGVGALLWLSSRNSNYLSTVISVLPYSDSVVLVDLPTLGGRNELIKLAKELSGEDSQQLKGELEKHISSIEAFGGGFLRNGDEEMTFSYVVVKTPFNLPINTYLLRRGLERNLMGYRVDAELEFMGERYLVIVAEDGTRSFVWVRGRVAFVTNDERVLKELISSSKGGPTQQEKLAALNLPPLGELWGDKSAILRWFYSSQLSLDDDLKDILRNTLGLEPPDRIALWSWGYSRQHGVIIKVNHNLQLNNYILSMLDLSQGDLYPYAPMISLKLRLSVSDEVFRSIERELSSELPGSEEFLRDLKWVLQAQYTAGLSLFSAERGVITLKVEAPDLTPDKVEGLLLPVPGATEVNCASVDPNLRKILDSDRCFRIPDGLIGATSGKAVAIAPLSMLPYNISVHQDNIPSDVFINLLSDEGLIPGLMLTFYLDEIAAVSKTDLNLLMDPENFHRVQNFERAMDKLSYKAIVIALTPDYQLGIALYR